MPVQCWPRGQCGCSVFRRQRWGKGGAGKQGWVPQCGQEPSTRCKLSYSGGEGLADIYRTFQLETILIALLENTFSMTSALEGVMRQCVLIEDML